MNLPTKSNTECSPGYEALTGKSNFDISESMISLLVKKLTNRDGILAMLCKTSVARRILQQAWRENLAIASARIHRIDAKFHFGVAVEACLLVCKFGHGKRSTECPVYDTLESTTSIQKWGYRQGRIVADIKCFDKYMYLYGKSKFRWRSGLKHDCVKVMELKPTSELHSYTNGFGESVALEPEYLYPIVKSTELFHEREPCKKVIVTQRRCGDATATIATTAPLTWQYLNEHAKLLDARSSSIYRNRPQFCMFGIGDYSFAPWKVAISGFHKVLEFRVIGNCEGKPYMLDDTCYFLPCESESMACRLHRALNRKPAQSFLESLIFWDAKRPINIELLSRLNLEILLDQEDDRKTDSLLLANVS